MSDEARMPISKSYFPIRIQYLSYDRKSNHPEYPEPIIINSPSNLKDGISFIVIQTNAKDTRDENLYKEHENVDSIIGIGTK